MMFFMVLFLDFNITFGIYRCLVSLIVRDVYDWNYCLGEGGNIWFL